MRIRNFKLIRKIWEKKLTQYELTKIAGLSSEARLSRIINSIVMPTEFEIVQLCRALGSSARQLGLQNNNLTNRNR